MTSDLASAPGPLDGFDAKLRERLARVRLAAFDVDGVLTEGRVTYAGETEQQSFDVKDGAALVWLRKSGVELVWITGRGCRATELRAAELGATLHAHVGDKRDRLAAVQAELRVDAAATLAMGDDLPDLGLADASALFCAPADAAREVRARADLVTRARGGRGAVREVCEALLAARGQWPPQRGDSIG